MARRRIRSGSSFEELVGFSRAVVDGDWIWVAGTTGFDYASMTISDDPAEQAEQTLRNIAAALEEAGASMADVVRAIYYLGEGVDIATVAPVIREHLGAAAPAATAVTAGFIDGRIKIEIEVTAVRQSR